VNDDKPGMVAETARTATAQPQVDKRSQGTSLPLTASDARTWSRYREPMELRRDRPGRLRARSCRRQPSVTS